MKYLTLTLVIITLIFTVTVLTGMTPLNQDYQDGLNEANNYVNDGNLDKAIEIYEGLLSDPQEKGTAKKNLGLVHYLKEDYEKVVEILLDSDAYMLLGNAYYRLSEGKEIPQEKIDLLSKSLEEYMNGIRTYPNDVEFKYNYEYVKKILDDLQQQQNEQQDQNNNKDNQDQEKQNEEGQDNQNQDSKNQDQSDDSQNQDNGDQDKKNQSNSSNDNQDAEDKDSKDMKNQQSNEEKEISDVDQEAINQVLKLLEQQEKESLKNNQTVIEQSKEDANDW